MRASQLQARNVAMGASDRNCGSDGFAVLETDFASTAPSFASAEAQRGHTRYKLFDKTVYIHVVGYKMFP